MGFYVTCAPLWGSNGFAYGIRGGKKHVSLLAQIILWALGVQSQFVERLQKDAGCYFDQEKRLIMALCSVSMGTSFTHPAGARCVNWLPHVMFKTTLLLVTSQIVRKGDNEQNIWGFFVYDHCLNFIAIKLHGKHKPMACYAPIFSHSILGSCQ